jgi:phosphoribosylanthranilate isomerase
VTIEQASLICAQVPAFVTIVALTVDADLQWLNQIVQELPIDLLQFHGNETPELCERANRPYMKALRMRPELDLVSEIERYSGARSVLLDAYRKGIPGGTGESFDWSLIPESHRERIVLAGGLSAENIETAVTSVRPYAVDVSGGVESSAGIKSKEKIVAFIRGVHRADGTA